MKDPPEVPGRRQCRDDDLAIELERNETSTGLANIIPKVMEFRDTMTMIAVLKTIG